jgi:hypothetical protein
MIEIFEKDSWKQKKLECAINKNGIEDVFESLCEYICEEELSEFLNYYCDDNDCWPED